MFTAYIVISIFTAAANTYAAIVDFRRPQWVLDNITKWGGLHSWLFTLGSLRPQARLDISGHWGSPDRDCSSRWSCLVFVSAITVVIRARWYSHLRWPVTYLLLAVASLALRLTVS